MADHEVSLVWRQRIQRERHGSAPRPAVAQHGSARADSWLDPRRRTHGFGELDRGTDHRRAGTGLADGEPDELYPLELAEGPGRCAEDWIAGGGCAGIQFDRGDAGTLPGRRPDVLVHQPSSSSVRASHSLMRGQISRWAARLATIRACPKSSENPSAREHTVKRFEGLPRASKSFRHPPTGAMTWSPAPARHQAGTVTSFSAAR